MTRLNHTSGLAGPRAWMVSRASKGWAGRLTRAAILCKIKKVRGDCRRPGWVWEGSIGARLWVGKMSRARWGL